jgi:hypothetical protein
LRPLDRRSRFEFRTISKDGTGGGRHVAARRGDVMIDCLGAWRLLREGGVMLMDDYTWMPDDPEAERVAPAVDTFLAWHTEAEVILKSEQVAVRKRLA